MSISASIDLRVVHSDTRRPVALLRTLEMLMKYGWSPGYNGHVWYLPLGETDAGECILETISTESLLEILKEKEAREELIVVSMTWKDTSIGGTLFLYDAKKAPDYGIRIPIGFRIDHNRKILDLGENQYMTDLNWYLEKFFLTFSTDDMYVEYYIYEEHC